jgi:hypothetical protein
VSYYWRNGMNTLETEIQGARAMGVRVDENVLAIDLTDGRTIITPLAWYPRLMYGTPQERASFEIIGDGRYIHWPALDEDLTVAGILAGHPSHENAESLKDWLATRRGTLKQPVHAVAEKKAKYGE